MQSVSEINFNIKFVHLFAADLSNPYVIRLARHVLRVLLAQFPFFKFNKSKIVTLTRTHSLKKSSFLSAVEIIFLDTFISIYGWGYLSKFVRKRQYFIMFFCKF